LNKNPPSSNVIDNFCEPNFDYVIRIPAGEDIIWDKHAVVNENIEIEGTLTIKCRVDIAEDIAIFIKPGGKLIVDAGILTSRCENTMWKGIKVAGGNSDFDIKMFNEAKIQNTSEAAITMWPTDFINQPANGIALIENSTFNDVRGVVGFFAKSSSFNPSYVKDCTINNARWGISNTNCHNIEVSANTFNDTELECIFGSMASFNIHNNNTFRS
jgi:parallel beta-helix repeat protein